MTFKKVTRLLERAAHPATPDAERIVCARQALKLLPSLEKPRTFDPSDFRRAVLWQAERNGGWYAWVDSLRLTVAKSTIHGQPVFTVTVGEDGFTELFHDAKSAKKFAEGRAGV